MKTVFKWVFGAIDIALIAVVTLVFVRAFDARSKPPLEPWHGALSAEVRARDLPPSSTLADYLRMRGHALRADAADDHRSRTPRRPNPLQPLRRGRRRQPAAVSEELESHLRDDSRRRDSGRRPSHPRTHRLALQRSCGGRDLCARGFLRSRPPDAGPRHDPGRPDGGPLGRLAGGHASRRARRPGAHRTEAPLPRRGLFERRRSRRPVRPRRSRRREPAARPTESSSSLR